MASMITRAEYTIYTGNTIATADEARYDALIEMASDYIIEICNNDFSGDYPLPVKMICANMVTYSVKMASSGGSSYQSETQGGWSYSLGNNSGSSALYPENIMLSLKPYTKAKIAFGTINLKPYDKRGLIYYDIE